VGVAQRLRCARVYQPLAMYRAPARAMFIGAATYPPACPNAPTARVPAVQAPAPLPSRRRRAQRARPRPV